MNKERRKAIEAVKLLIENFDNLRMEIHDAIDEIAGAESDAFDAMPESLQEGDKGQAIEAARDALYEARDYFADMCVGDALDMLEGASQ